MTNRRFNIQPYHTWALTQTSISHERKCLQFIVLNEIEDIDLMQNQNLIYSTRNSSVLIVDVTN